MLEDFLKEKTPRYTKDGQEIPQEKEPLYDFCHIVFSGPISNDLLKQISLNKELIYALLSIRQINMDIYVKDENMFTLDLPLKSEKIIMENDEDKLNEKMMEKLKLKTLSIFTLFKNVEFVQLIYEKSGIARKLGDSLVEPLKELIRKISEKKATKNIYPPIFFIILNR